MTSPPLALLNRRSEPHARAVLADWYAERGLKAPPRLGVALAAAAAAAAADAADDAAAAAADDADAADDAADAAAADAAAAAADAADDADAALQKRLLNPLLGDIDMRDGLVLVQFPGGYYRNVTRVGWLRRVEGDEFELLGAVTVWRQSGSFDPAGLEKLAAKGLGKEYAASEPSASVELAHRLTVRRVLRADEKAWAKVCPKPKGWVEQ